MEMNGFGTVLILLLFSDVHLDLQRCPHGMNRKIRAKLICSEENRYHCILDKNKHIHIEVCKNPKVYRKGFRPVYKGNIDAEKCAFDNFSPGSILSNESDKCTYIKSNCTDAGQLVFENGSTETDRSCRCDYKRGYAFIIAPRHHNSCFPLDEDCSCYLKKCQDKRQVLTPDYVCAEESNVSVVFGYPSITIDPIQNKSTEALHTKKTEKTAKSSLMQACLILVYVCLTALLVIVILLCLCHEYDNKQSHPQETKRKMETVTEKDSDMNETRYIDNVNWTDRSLEIMNVVPHFHEIKQLEDMRTADRKPKVRLIILIGPHGAGKTQAAHKFCWECKEQYYIICKLTATSNVSLKDSMKKLAMFLSLKLSPECSNNEDDFFQDSASLLVNYFNHKSRSNYSFLLIIDDVFFENINTDPLYNLIVKLVNDVRMLKIIITTLTRDLLSDFGEEQRQEIHFDGMSKDEYLSFFRKTKWFKEQTDKIIDKLVHATGSLPITLNSARHYIEHLKIKIPKYIDILKEVEESRDESISNELGENVITPLLVSFKSIIDDLKSKYKDTTEVIMLLQYLDYRAVWQDMIEICYRHYSSDKSIAKTAAAAVVNRFLKYSLCNLVEKTKGNMLSFHPEIMLALKVFDKHNRKNDVKRLCFLIQVFCFEIDIDVRVDISMDRNFLFLDHARKVLNQLQAVKKNDDSVKENGNIEQTQVFLCYLNYVIGKTFLFKATDIPLAHKHLMEARYLCLNIIGQYSDLADKNCSFFRTDTDEIPHMKSSHVRDAFKTFCEFEMPIEFFESFVFCKYRNERDVHILRNESKIETLCEHGYLTQNDYSSLFSIKPSLVMPLNLISKGFIAELMLHILFDNGRALDELMHEAQCYEHAKKGRDFEFKTCIEFTNLMKTRTEFENFPLLRYLVFDRGEQRYKLEKDDKMSSIESVKRRIQEIKKVKDSGHKHYFQFGILKTSTEDNEYHNCVCYRLLLKYHQELYKISESADILSDARNDMEEFLRILLNIEKDEKHSKWVEMPKFFIQCAKVLHMSKKDEDCEKAIEIFEKVINIEEHKGVHLTRYVWQAYYGKASCLLTLGRKDDAKIIHHQLQKRLEGTHQNYRIQKLEVLSSELIKSHKR
ncbi:uncharacterized protein [Mytilus edulis]|uniref:uncharacterized protein n=1 Tax=Mytilus edulis TaxID=6550 RepID=UPI0039EF8C59